MNKAKSLASREWYKGSEQEQLPNLQSFCGVWGSWTESVGSLVGWPLGSGRVVKLNTCQGRVHLSAAGTQGSCPDSLGPTVTRPFMQWSSRRSPSYSSLNFLFLFLAVLGLPILIRTSCPVPLLYWPRSPGSNFQLSVYFPGVCVRTERDVSGLGWPAAQGGPLTTRRPHGTRAAEDT